MEIRRLLRYRLSTVLVLMIPLGILFFWLGVFLDRRPIEWTVYSPAAMNEGSRDHDAVLLFFTADWDATAAFIEKTSLNHWRVRHMIRSNDVATIKVDLTDFRSPNNEILKSLGRSMTPTVAIYSSRWPEPLILDGLISEYDLMNAISDAH